MNLKQSVAFHKCLLVLEPLDTYTRRAVIENLVELEKAGGEAVVQVAPQVRVRPVRYKRRKQRRTKSQGSIEIGPQTHSHSRKGNHSTDEGSFAEALRRERNKLGITQQALAEKLGLHRSLIGLYEGGYAAPATERTIGPLKREFPGLARFFQN